MSCKKSFHFIVFFSHFILFTPFVINVFTIIVLAESRGTAARKNKVFEQLQKRKAAIILKNQRM
jgi:hypothetical protein